MQTPWCLGVMGFFLVFVPIIGMHLVHKYGWEHWNPSPKNTNELHTTTVSLTIGHHLCVDEIYCLDICC